MPKWLLSIIIVLVIAALAYLGVRQLIKAISKRPTDLGWQGQSFRPCPDMPNCVHSLSNDPRHAIAPFALKEDVPTAMARMVALIEAMPRSTIVSRTANYLHAEFRTAGFGYVDDVELFFDDQAGLIQVRSGARVPYYDFDVNRKRVESLRATLEAGQ